MMSALSDNLALIQKNMALAEGATNRKITLIAVSKNQPLVKIKSAYDLGVRHFGENKWQEATQKFTQADFRADITLHFIGHLQTNKVKKAVRFFDYIHSLDRPSLAESLGREQQQWEGGKPFPKLLIEVNVGKEPQKSGIAPEALVDFYHHCREDLSLPVIGLMTILPLGQPPAPFFAYMNKMAGELQPMNQPLELSMGMTEDYKEAMELGATMIRIGTGLFGERKPI